MPEFVKKDHDYSAVESYLQNNDVNITNNLNVGGNIAGKVPLRDYIINGSFKYWLDNTGLSASTGVRYTATLYRTVAIGNTIAVTRNAHTVGQADIPTNSAYYATFAATDDSSTSGVMAIQPMCMEDVKKYSNKTQILSIWCRASSGTPNISMEANQSFGSGGSPNVTSISVKKFSISTSWNRYDCVINWPSISGKTLGAGGTHYAYFNIWISAGSDSDARTNTLGHQAITVDIAKVQLIDGPVYQYIPERSESEELAMIGRYYEKSYSPQDIPTTITLASCHYGTAVNPYDLKSPIIPFKTTKRTNPTIQFYSTNSGTVGKWYDFVGAIDIPINQNGYAVGCNSFSTNQTNILTYDKPYYFHWVADARF